MSATACASCGRANRAGARFCDGCGATLAPRCPACHTECRAAAQFCDACGASLAAAGTSGAAQPDAAPRAGGSEARKVVTIVFADLIGSTALQERLDPESVSRLMDRYHRAVRGPIEAHGGTVVQLLGDGVMCAFGVPRVAEDDAIRAVHAGVAVQRAFREFAAREGAVAERIGLRVAINTGEVVVSDDHAAGIGDPLNVAGRLQQEAADGDVLISGSTERVVGTRVTLAPVGRFALKGRSEPVAAFRVVSLERPAGAPAVPFVGRDAELERLGAVYEAAVGKPAARLAVVLGSPGLGKSRLLAEFTRRVGAGATVLLAQCQAAGGATFAPLAEALRAPLGVEPGAGDETVRAAIDGAVPGDEAERARIARGIGALLAGTPASPEETFFVVRRLLAALAAAQPVVLAIDDLQWAEPLLLDLTEHLAQWGAGVRLLVLVAARPELRDMRSSLASPGGAVSDVVTLGGLDAGAATRLAASVIGASALPAAVAGRVLATSEGNPLFLGELVRMLVHDGALRREGDRWTTAVELADLEMPPTIQALLAARIERLRPEDRLVLERAAVVGRQFSRGALVQLLPGDAHADLDARLESLRRSELIEPDSGWLLGEPVLRFHHVLIRDAAYRRLLRNTRAELHERFADWLVARAGDSAPHDETIGWHLEQAHQHLRELGSLDAHGRGLGERAARHLAAAGRRALARDDLLPAAGLLGRALDGLGADDPARADLVLDWCEALLAAGDVGTASRSIAELGRLMPGSEHLRAWHTCFSGQLAVLTDPKALRASEGAVAAAAETLTAAGDTTGEAKAHAVHALVLAQLGKIGACEAALDRALAAARRAGASRLSNVVLAGAPVAALWGPSPVTRASGRCLDVVRVLRITQGAPAVEAVALQCQAVLETLRGRGDAARRMIASSRQLVEELGITQRVLEADLFGGLIELLEGDAAAAEPWLVSAWDGLREQGLGISASQAGALLARALLAQGRIDEAEAVSHASESLAGDSFKAAIAWRGVRAEVLAARGEHAAAADLASKAVEIAAATDDLLDHADARASLAVALRAAGRGAEADAEERRAIELWEAKGATLLVERARRGGTAGARVATAPLEAAPSAPVTRARVPENHATRHQARLDEAVAAGDLRAVARLLGDARLVDHVHGQAFGADTLLDRFRLMIERSAGLAFRNVPIAVLGPSLALARWLETGAGAVTGELAVGSYEVGGTVLIEADSEAGLKHVESFAADRFGDAVVRLYERHAELLPEGPERERAAAVARAVATQHGSVDLEGLAAAFAPDVELVDRRTLGFGSARGAPTFLRFIESLVEAAPDSTNRIDDVLAVRSDAMLLRITNSGTDRVTGGAFERCLLRLVVFGAEGRMTRHEQFDPDRDVEALARFEELAAPAPARLPTRRVRPNAATASAARLCAAIAVRDIDALPALVSDDMEVLHQPTHSVYGRDEALRVWRSLIQGQEGRLVVEPLGTLGDSLALCRHVTSAGGAAGRKFDVGAFEVENLLVSEVDERGRQRRGEFFDAGRLGDAVVRLYERYAELLPEGHERTRAAATARSVAEKVGPIDFDRYAAAFAPTIEAVDHRILGTWSARGSDALLEHFRAFLALAEGATLRADDVLALRPDAHLIRWMNSGSDRAGGGAYERPFLMLSAYGADGRETRIEWFDPGREAEALARFETLVAKPEPGRRRVRPNAATESAARTVAAVRGRDVAALPDLFSADFEAVHHPTGATYGHEGAVATARLTIGNRDVSFRQDPLATLGDRLALLENVVSSSGAVRGAMDVGPFESELIHVAEVDERARRRRNETFRRDQLGEAIARLYERYAELLPEGPERTRAVAIAHSVAICNGPPDLDRFVTSMAPSVEVVDHRVLGTWSGRGLEAALRNWRAQLDLAADATLRDDDVLALEPDAYLVRRTFLGIARAGGGPYENPCLALFALGADGLVTRAEVFDPDREAEALARFEELTREVPPPTRIENAATRWVDRFEAACEARDLNRIAASAARGLRHIDRRRLLQLDLDRDQHLEWMRTALERRFRTSSEVIGTRGDRLALFRVRSLESDEIAGPSEHQFLGIAEVNDRGESLALLLLEPDDLDAAYTELDARYAAGEAAPYARAWAALARFPGIVAARDWERLTSSFAPELVVEDHRQIGLLNALSRDEWVASARSLVGLRPDVTLRMEHVLALDDRRSFVVLRWVGSDAAGAFEIPVLVVAEHGPEGARRLHAYDLGQLDAARARYDALGASERPDPLSIPPNAATRARDRFWECIEKRDWESLRALCARIRWEDRRRLVRTTGDCETVLGNAKLISHAGSRVSRTRLATAGDRLVLERVRFTGAPDAGSFETEVLDVLEVDVEGRIVALITLDPDDRRAASRELLERWAASDAARGVPVRVRRAILDRDLERLRAELPDGYVFHDHRRTGAGRIEGVDEYVAWIATLLEASPDAIQEPLYYVAIDRHAFLAVVHVFGTRVDGGAFESAFSMVSGPGVTELFEPEDLDLARARFEELRPKA